MFRFAKHLKCAHTEWVGRHVYHNGSISVKSENKISITSIFQIEKVVGEKCTGQIETIWKIVYLWYLWYLNYLWYYLWYLYDRNYLWYLYDLYKTLYLKKTYITCNLYWFLGKNVNGVDGLTIY